MPSNMKLLLCFLLCLCFFSMVLGGGVSMGSRTDGFGLYHHEDTTDRSGTQVFSFDHSPSKQRHLLDDGTTVVSVKNVASLNDTSRIHSSKSSAICPNGNIFYQPDVVSETGVYYDVKNKVFVEYAFEGTNLVADSFIGPISTNDGRMFFFNKNPVAGHEAAGGGDTMNMYFVNCLAFAAGTPVVLSYEIPTATLDVKPNYEWGTPCYLSVEKRLYFPPHKNADQMHYLDVGYFYFPKIMTFGSADFTAGTSSVSCAALEQERSIVFAPASATSTIMVVKHDPFGYAKLNYIAAGPLTSDLSDLSGSNVAAYTDAVYVEGWQRVYFVPEGAFPLKSWHYYDVSRQEVGAYMVNHDAVGIIGSQDCNKDIDDCAQSFTPILDDVGGRLFLLPSNTQVRTSTVYTSEWLNTILYVALDEDVDSVQAVGGFDFLAGILNDVDVTSDGRVTHMVQDHNKVLTLVSNSMHASLSRTTFPGGKSRKLAAAKEGLQRTTGSNNVPLQDVDMDSYIHQTEEVPVNNVANSHVYTGKFPLTPNTRDPVTCPDGRIFFLPEMKINIDRIAFFDPKTREWGTVQTDRNVFGVDTDAEIAPMLGTWLMTPGGRAFHTPLQRSDDLAVLDKRYYDQWIYFNCLDEIPVFKKVDISNAPTLGSMSYGRPCYMADLGRLYYPPSIGMNGTDPVTHTHYHYLDLVPDTPAMVEVPIDNPIWTFSLPLIYYEKAVCVPGHQQVVFPPLQAPLGGPCHSIYHEDDGTIVFHDYECEFLETDRLVEGLNMPSGSYVAPMFYSAGYYYGAKHRVVLVPFGAYSMSSLYFYDLLQKRIMPYVNQVAPYLPLLPDCGTGDNMELGACSDSTFGYIAEDGKTYFFQRWPHMAVNISSDGHFAHDSSVTLHTILDEFGMNMIGSHLPLEDFRRPPQEVGCKISQEMKSFTYGKDSMYQSPQVNYAIGLDRSVYTFMFCNFGGEFIPGGFYDPRETSDVLVYKTEFPNHANYAFNEQAMLEKTSGQY